MLTNKKRNLMMMLVLILAVALTACGGKKDTSTGDTSTGTGTELSGTIEIDGSSTVFPLTEAAAEEFGKENSKVRVSVGTAGTGGGFKRFVKGELAMANASREIKDSEAEAAKAAGIDYTVLEVAYDGLSVVVNKDNTWVDKLTLDELKKIYGPGSTAKTWADVRPGWPAEEIKIYSPGSEHGTFDYFTEVINGKAQESRNDKQITFAADTNSIVSGVEGDKNAIGYFGFSFYEENKDKMKIVPIDNGTSVVTPSAETIKDKSYAPLSRALYVYASNKDLARPEVKAFTEFYLKNVGSFASEVGFIALPQEMYDEQIAKLNK
jgi:phosphate transport system substrate-binding protein